MTSKNLIILGVVSYILSVVSSLENSDGIYTMPLLFILISGIIQFAFIIIAVIYLWKKHKITSILFLVFSIASLIYLSPITKIGYFITFIWVISLLWAMAKYEKLALTPEKDINIDSK